MCVDSTFGAWRVHLAEELDQLGFLNEFFIV